MARGTFTIDTCVILMVCRGPHRKEFAKCLRDTNSFDGATILLNSMIVTELARHGLEQDRVRDMLVDALGVRVEVAEITDDVSESARRMTAIYPELHPGDDEILACAVKHKSTLITCDRDLAMVARQAGVRVKNPDIANAETRHRLEQNLARHNLDAGPRKKRMSATRQARAWVGRQQDLVTKRDTSQKVTALRVLELQQKELTRKQNTQKKSWHAKQLRRNHREQLRKLAQCSPGRGG